MTGSNHKKTQATQDRHYNIQKSQEKTSTTKTRATHNQHNKDRRYNIPLWVARFIVGVS